jgi:hypothetical protein
MEFNTEFLQFSSPRTSIYRLKVQMSVWLDKTGRRSDDGHGPSVRMQAGVVRSFSTQGKVWTESSRHLDGWCYEHFGVLTKIHIVRTDSALNSWASRWYGTSSGRLTGNRIFWLVNWAESSVSTLNSGSPVKKHHYKEVILSNRMWPTERLTLLIGKLFKKSNRELKKIKQEK